MAVNYNIPMRSKMNKAELVEVIPDYIRDVEALEKILLIARENEMKLFRRVLGHGHIESNMIYLGEYGYFMKMGLMFSFWDGDRFHLVIPDEVRDLYKEIDMNELTEGYNRIQNVYKYILALANLYGVFDVELLIDIFNSQNRDALDKNEFLEIYFMLSSRDQIFWMSFEVIAIDYFLYFEDGAEELSQLMMDQYYKPHYIPERDKLLKYADGSYFEWTPQLEALQNFILKEMCDDRELVEYLVDDIQMTCSMEADLQIVFKEFERREIYIEDEEQLKKLIPLIMDVYNNTRLWANCRHTPKEIAEMSGESDAEPLTQQRRVTKIGRNDPCPCGSGKKYKKCCGR